MASCLMTILFFLHYPGAAFTLTKWEKLKEKKLEKKLKSVTLGKGGSKNVILQLTYLLSDTLLCDISKPTAV